MQQTLTAGQFTKALRQTLASSLQQLIHHVPPKARVGLSRRTALEQLVTLAEAMVLQHELEKKKGPSLNSPHETFEQEGRADDLLCKIDLLVTTTTDAEEHGFYRLAPKPTDPLTHPSFQLLSSDRLRDFRRVAFEVATEVHDLAKSIRDSVKILCLAS